MTKKSADDYDRTEDYNERIARDTRQLQEQVRILLGARHVAECATRGCNCLECRAYRVGQQSQRSNQR